MGTAIILGILLLSAAGLLLYAARWRRALATERARRVRLKTELDDAKNAIAYLQAHGRALSCHLAERDNQLASSQRGFEILHGLFIWALNQTNPTLAEKLSAEFFRDRLKVELARAAAAAGRRG